MVKYSFEEVQKSTLEYFKNDSLASDVWIKKYCLKDSENNYYELNPNDMHRRLAKEFARIEKNYPNSLSEDEIFELFKDFKYVLPQGRPMAGIGNTKQVQSISNCFVVDVGQNDSYGAIFHLDQQMGHIYRRGGGCGADISFIRPQGAPVRNAALSSTGITTFMERLSNTTREVGQENRRGATLLTIDISHFQSPDFVTAKDDKQKITGANISLKITDEFMKSVIEDGDFTLQFPVNDSNPKFKKTIKARELWNTIIKQNISGSEPGIFFWSTILKESLADCYSDDGFKSVSANPCLTGDVKVLVADGRGFVTIKELASISLDVPVYTINKSGEVVVKTMYNPRLTGENKKIYEIKFGDGKSVKCTENHKFALSDGTYKEAKTLTVGDILYAKHFSETDLSTIYETAKLNNVEIDGISYVEKTCEICGDKFLAPIYNREVCMCSDECSEKYKSIPKEFNNECSIGLSIKSIVECGFEDVYNGTVEEFHNFFIGGWYNSKTSKYTTINNLQCGEIILSDKDSCRLMIHNLVGYVENKFSKDAYFDFVKFAEHVYKAQKLMDDLVDLEIEKVDEIISKIKSDPETEEVKRIELKLWEDIRLVGIKGRRTGLGYTGLADVFAMCNLNYGSKESIELAFEIQKTLNKNAYRASIDMAKERGAFPAFNYDKEKDNVYLKRVLEYSPELKEDLIKYGRRNIALLTNSPTGSTSCLTQTSSGIEPVYLLSYKRRRKILSGETKVDFIDVKGDKWQEYIVYHKGFQDYLSFKGIDYTKLNESELNDIVKDSPYFYTTYNVDSEDKVKLVSTIQKLNCHAISSSTNFPKGTTFETVDKMYKLAWELGCKGMTIYVDGSRDGVLVSTDTKKESKEVKQIDTKRPESLPCDIHHISALSKKWYVIIGLKDNKPYELFTLLRKGIHIPDGRKSGELIKVGSGKYNLKTNGFLFEDINQFFENPEDETDVRLISGMLKHNVPISFICEQLDKAKGSVVSLAKAISRTFKKHYLTEQDFKEMMEVGGEKCPECGEKLIFSQGCKSCTCGYSKCG